MHLPTHGVVMSFEQSLGYMAALPQFFVWRLEWDAEEGKYQKWPASLDGTQWPVDAGNPTTWGHYVDALATVQRYPRGTYALGFYLTGNEGVWFFDLDKCYDDIGNLIPLAQEFVNRFPGAMMERSSSGRGIHIFGSGPVPDHRMKTPKEKRSTLPFDIEFYTSHRGVAFGLDLVANGSIDTRHDLAVAALIAEYFPPRAHADVDARPEWRGPTDDEELIRRMLRANESAEAAFGRKASITKLWNGEVEKNNENDMALASHLAFWTGCDIERMERIARRSGMYRPKWDTRRRHTTYIGFTCENAATSCANVYQEPVRDIAKPAGLLYGTPAPPTLTTVQRTTPLDETTLARCDELSHLIAECGTLAEVHNKAIVAVRDAQLPRALAETLCSAINKKLDLFGGKLPISQIRALVMPPIIATHHDTPPLWLQKHCFVKAGDYFFNTESGGVSSAMAFEGEYARQMPIKDNGKRESVVEWAFQKWNIRIVDDVAYRPGADVYFHWRGKEYANTFVPSSIPPLEDYTTECCAQIDAFQRHLMAVCNNRLDVFNMLLQWMAHNVQRPGVKIRWAPLIKGVPGDGKSILANVMRAALGDANVLTTSIANLTNNGGFTDWAANRAVNFIEEIHLDGKERFRVFNMMKEYISNDTADINAKGGKAYNIINVTNHGAFTNYTNGVPIKDDDRRWLILFTPWADIQGAAEAKGMADANALVQSFKAIGDATRQYPGQWRRWLMGVDISSFDPDARAMKTDEREIMIASSGDAAEQAIADIIEQGGLGVRSEVFSSSHLLNLLKLKQITNPSIEIPKSSAWHLMITRLGYHQLPKPVKWDGATVRVWLKPTKESWRGLLDETRNRPVTNPVTGANP